MLHHSFTTNKLWCSSLAVHSLFQIGLNKSVWFSRNGFESRIFFGFLICFRVTALTNDSARYPNFTKTTSLCATKSARFVHLIRVRTEHFFEKLGSPLSSFATKLNDTKTGKKTSLTQIVVQNKHGMLADGSVNQMMLDHTSKMQLSILADLQQRL